MRFYPFGGRLTDRNGDTVDRSALNGVRISRVSCNQWWHPQAGPHGAEGTVALAAGGSFVDIAVEKAENFLTTSSSEHTGQETCSDASAFLTSVSKS